MRRQGFTLVELMVVIGIIVLLVAAILPSFQSSYSVARRTLCMNNLSQIMAGIKMARVKHAPALGRPLPEKSEWPGLAYEGAPDVGLFRCPEDPREGEPLDVIPNLYYQSGITGEMLAFNPGDRNSQGEKSCATRRGVDAEGAYSEFVIEENPYYESVFVGSPRYLELCVNPGPNRTYAGCDFSNNDGVWRVYDNINGNRVVRLVYYTCGLENRLWYKGQNMWPGLAGHKYPDTKDQLLLPPAFATSYALNENLDKKYLVRPETIVALDFMEQFARPTTDGGFQQKLDSPDSSRHRGACNVLTADCSVRTMNRMWLYPGICTKWQP
jgi:prepilin-type N-terminal cleavage/methylation domain-containing protein/prepilin-type processing-associated H-X9-DG protein